MHVLPVVSQTLCHTYEFSLNTLKIIRCSLSLRYPMLHSGLVAVLVWVHPRANHETRVRAHVVDLGGDSRKPCWGSREEEEASEGDIIKRGTVVDNYYLIHWRTKGACSSFRAHGYLSCIYLVVCFSFHAWSVMTIMRSPFVIFTSFLILDPLF